MKKCIIHIYIMAILASLLASCTSILDEEAIREQDKTGISFTLSMNSVGATSRALAEDRVTLYENAIDQDKFRILAYTADGKAHEVTIFYINKTSENVYQISGELNNVPAINRVVVLANCYSGYNLTDELSSLLYTYSTPDMNPESPKAYIPMWGEKITNAFLTPGTNTDLGLIYLMRAMAKISVKSTGAEDLNSVSWNSANDRGNFVPAPANVAGTGDNLSVTAPTIPAGVTKIASLPFYKLNEKEAFIYLPEQERTDRPEMTIKLGGKDYTLPFMDYREFEQGASCPVLRNTHYLFNVSIKAGWDFKLEYKVVPWGTEDIDIDFN